MKKDKIVTYIFELEISVDVEGVSRKYPNYRFSFNKSEEFVNFLVNDLIHSGDIDLSKDDRDKFGYSVSIKPIKK